MLQTIKNIAHKLSSYIATIIHAYPAHTMTVIGITGTDGKTTTTELVYHMLKTAGKNVSMISTLRAVIGNKEYDTGFHVTTPSAFSLQKYLKEAKQVGTKYMILEVTSHGLDQERILGASIDMGVVLNISHEHLDYHKTFDNYLSAKAKILQGVKWSIINRDDPNYQLLMKKASGKVQTFAIHEDADFTYSKFPFKTSLPGEYNKYNVLAAAAIAKTIGIDDKKIQDALNNFGGIKGRMEEVKTEKEFRIFVDFAHKPNALKNVLKTVRGMTLGKVIVIFGCAGLRDKLKRPMMGEIAGKLADVSILTAEDPRTEDVRNIIDEIAQGSLRAKALEIEKKKNISWIKKNEEKHFIKISDRQEAINYALRKIARKGDIVLITGKGHEKSMCYGTTEYPWDEWQAIAKALHD